MDHDRLNSPSTSAIKIELLGHQLQFSQDPNSNHLGTTVWDASMVFAKFLERNCRKGKFCPSKLRGKRVIELGAGCGVAGMAMLGCDVILTDQKEVLQLLQRNVDRNISRISQMNPGPDLIGSIKVTELDWGNMDHVQAVAGPFDYIIGTDVVYVEHLLEPLLQTILALSGPRTTVMLGYEIRSTSVHEKMLELWKSNFDVKTIPKSKMHSRYQHQSIHLYTMVAKKEMIPEINPGSDEETVSEEQKAESSNVEVNDDKCGKKENDNEKEGSIIATGLPRKELSDWEVRRYGSMAARLLRDVKIT
ncbi:hypothetical protein V2J09_009974 [Rumex salicifolius]